jgi:pyruvate ferredoxin oxidoreductase gamma subunit/2-oxoisovalerate ferredoxin oxidoreductase gamma subunit
MSKLFEVRFHGRGGQGAWTASLLLAQAALKERKYIQSFPAFGPERAGAPITAFTRISDENIQIHSSIYEPDVVVVLDPTLLGPSVADGVTDDTIMIINSSESGAAVRGKLGLEDVETWVVDATGLAMNILGRPITNTAMLGSVVKATNIVELESLQEAITERFRGKIGEVNVEVIKAAFKEVRKE